MEKYKCQNPDSSIVIELIRHTYPNIDISDRNFTFKIHDSGYPSVQVNMKDDGFDDLVNEMRAFAPVDLPMEFADNFKRWVLMDKLKPSVALRKLMEKYNCSEMDVAVPIKLLELTYPDINVTCNGFRFKIVDSAYPNSDPKQFSDEDFDQGIEELLSLPPAEWQFQIYRPDFI